MQDPQSTSDLLLQLLRAEAATEALYCPKCGADIVTADRSPDGHSKCSTGCRIPNQEVSPFCPAIARLRSKRTLRTQTIKPFLEAVYKAIREATDEGKNSIMLYSAWQGSNSPSLDQEKAVRESLVRGGWNVEHHDDPDPGHPCSTGAYYTVEW